MDVNELLDQSLIILNDQNIHGIKENGGISFKHGDIDFAIRIDQIDNIFLFSIGSNFTEEFEKSMKDDINVLNLMGRNIQKEIPFVRISFTSLQAGDRTLFNKNLRYDDIIGYTCKCDIENFINDTSILKNIIPFFIQIQTSVTQIVKENIE